MNKNILLIAAILSMFVFSVQVAEPAAAASLKVVDHGAIKLKDPVNNSKFITYKWTTYQRGTSYVAMIGYLYSPGTNKGVYTYIYLQKVRKNLIKMYGKQIMKNYNTRTSTTKKLSTTYCYTKLTAAQAYWRVIKPSFLQGLKEAANGG